MSENARDDYIHYRLQRAIETLDEAELLLDNGYWNTAINRMYYACFYAVGALLVKNGIQASSHVGCRSQFGLHFVKNGKVSKRLGKHYTKLFRKRQKGDYDDFIDFEEDTARELFQPSRKLVNLIKELIENQQKD